ncbi:hypothetical protein HDU93_009853 [Gonapodya sp. JEL0774]|nr:hypothetical protein HDU93_009853 [Gonapodya sp. JEL0774]
MAIGSTSVAIAPKPLSQGELPPKEQVLAAVEALYETHAGLKRAREEVEELLRSARTSLSTDPSSTAANTVASLSSTLAAQVDARFNTLSTDLWTRVQGALGEVNNRLRALERRGSASVQNGSSLRVEVGSTSHEGDMEVENGQDVKVE